MERNSDCLAWARLLQPPVWGGLGVLFMSTAMAEATATDTEVESAVESEEITFNLVRIVEGLEHPWAVDWLPDGRMLITERPGRMHLLEDGQLTELGNLPSMDVEEDDDAPPDDGNQGGLLDVAVHPDYADNGWIYFTYSSPGDDDAVLGGEPGYATGTALARARLNEEGTELTDVETLYAQVPRTEPGRHYGSRILFPGDGTVLFSIGDRGIRYPSQDLTDPAGSIIRLHEDGGAAEGNPFIGEGPGNLRPEIYSFGHRNNQGMAMNPETGEIWALDHGPFGGDLLYRVEAGANYGWPQVAHGTEYSTREAIGIGTEAPGVQEPEHVWEDSMAPSGLAFYDGEAFPGWDGNLFAGSLLQEQLHRLELNDGEVSHEEILLSGTIGRIRDVRQGPDGLIYLVTDEPDGGVYRMEPVEQEAEEE